MKKFLELISEEMGKGFEAAGYEAQLGRVTVSNRPDLCEYQCNGAMAGAKKYHKAPIMIANDVAEKLTDSAVFSEVSAVAPGFLNLKVKDSFVCEYLKEMAAAEKFGVEPPEKKKTIVVDYGGPNVAKPLHVGHLRSAVIGESIKRINRYKGHRVIGDVHLGDWGLQMGLIITELKARKPELPYFDESFTGEYPQEAPFTVSELEEIYPTASGKSKEDPAYKEAAQVNQSSVEAVEQAKKKQEEAEKQARQAEYQIEREKNRADMEIQRARRKAKSEIADMKENQFFWDWGYLCVIFFSFLQNGAFQQDVLQLIMIPINWCKEYIAWFERLEYISDTAGEMLFKGFFSMLMITAGILGCVFLVWAGVEQYKKIWDDLYKMVLISSISFVAVLGNLIREYLPLNLILVILFINIGTILLRAYLKKKYPQMYD